MHEVSIAENIIDIIKCSLNTEQFSQILSLHLKVGPLSGVDPEALKFALESIAEGTLIENAAINIEVTEIQGFCFKCGGEFNASDIRFICPLCGSNEVKIVSGNELEIIDLEVK